MAVTRAIRWNLQAGTLGSSVAATDSTINFGAVPSFPSLNNAASGDYIPITLINSTALQSSEIVYLTGYTAGNSTGQILRAQESNSGGGAAASFAQGQTWEHSPTAFEQVGPGGYTISGNTSGTGALLSAGTITLAGGDNVTISQSNNAVTISGQPPILSVFPPIPMITALNNFTQASGNSAATNTTVSMNMYPMQLANPLVYNEINLPVLMSATTTVTSQNWSSSNGITFGLYTKSGASLNLLSSWSNVQFFSHASTNTSGSGSASWQMSFGGSATQFSSTASISTATATAAGFWTLITGTKLLPFHTGSSASLSAGQYYVAVANSLLTAGSNLGGGVKSAAAISGGSSMQGIGLSTNSTTGLYPLQGTLSSVLFSNQLFPTSFYTTQILTTGVAGFNSVSQIFYWAYRTT